MSRHSLLRIAVFAIACAWTALPANASAGVLLTSEEVQVQSGDKMVRGVLRRPLQGSELPGIVLLPGDGALNAGNLSAWADSLAIRGFAVLAMEVDTLGDSRVPRTNRAQRLGGIAASAVRSLRAHAAVGSAVGTIASGRDTWALPFAAAQDSLLAFAVALSGGPLALGDQELYRRKQLLVADGYEPANVERGGSLVWIYFEYLKSNGTSREANVQAEYKRYRNEPWFPLLELPDEDPTAGSWPEERKAFALALNFDPIPVFATMQVPMLAVLGANDRVTPVGATARSYESLGKPNLTVRVLEGADHELDRADSPAPVAFEVYRIVDEWIRQAVAPSTSP